MENPYEGPALGGQQDNTGNRVNAESTVKSCIIMSYRSVYVGRYYLILIALKKNIAKYSSKI